MLKAMIVGNLGNDPDMRYSANGTPLLRFNVASNYRTREQDGEYQDKTEWVQVTVTGTRAESLSQYLRKGAKVFVDGRLEARPWTDQQGQLRSGLQILANEVQFMSPRNEDEQRNGYSQDRREPAATTAQRPRQDTRQQMGLEDDDIDLPF